MSDVNVIQRTQRIIVAPASSSVSVISTGPTGPTGPPGPAHPSGVASVSGLAARGNQLLAVTAGGLGHWVMLDPVGGIIEKLGSDVEFDDKGPTLTYEMKIMTAGLYHINGYLRIDGVAPNPGGLLGIRVNGIARRREMFVPTAWTSVTISCDANLLPGDRVGLFTYSTGGTWTSSPIANPTAIDPYSPYLEIWRVVGGPKGDPG